MLQFFILLFFNNAELFEKNYKVVYFNLFTYNLACLNQILFGKECHKIDVFCIF